MQVDPDITVDPQGPPFLQRGTGLCEAPSLNRLGSSQGAEAPLLHRISYVRVHCSTRESRAAYPKAEGSGPFHPKDVRRTPERVSGTHPRSATCALSFRCIGKGSARSWWGG